MKTSQEASYKVLYIWYLCRLCHAQNRDSQPQEGMNNDLMLLLHTQNTHVRVTAAREDRRFVPSSLSAWALGAQFGDMSSEIS